MNNKIQKHDLFKIIGLVIIFTTILTWIIPTGSFNETEYVAGELNRIGLVDFFSSFLTSIQYFLSQITFLLVLGGFYGVLSKIKAYQEFVGSIAKKLKGHEIIFVLVITFFFAALASLSVSLYQILLLAPFIISIILKAKMDKITAFAATFGALLIGTLGATYSGAGLNYLNEYLGTTFETMIWVKVTIFALTYILFNYFSIVHIKKALATKSKEEIEDRFEVVETTDKKPTSSTPLLIIVGIIFAIQVVGYIDWSGAFNITIFNEFHEWLTAYTIGDYTLFQYILGSPNTISPIGQWDLLIIQIIMFFASIVLAVIYKVKINDFLTAGGDGIKKMLKPTLMLVLVNIIFVLVYWTPFVPTIVDYILGLSGSFNIFLLSISGLLASFFHTDFGYTGYLFGTYFANQFSTHKEIILIIMNSTHGLVQFFAPTSALLMVGLAYLNIEYKTWIKYIWKFLVGMLIILMIIFSLITYVF